MRVLTLVFVLAGCGSGPPPKTEQLESDLAACNKNVAATRARIRELMAEKIKVTNNRNNMPADYDTASIDQTMAQIDSELAMRENSAARMDQRCETIDNKLHAAKMAQPL